MCPHYNDAADKHPVFQHLAHDQLITCHFYKQYLHKDFCKESLSHLYYSRPATSHSERNKNGTQFCMAILVNTKLTSHNFRAQNAQKWI